ncbi:hypothetical protein RZS08_47500, partial [Arthrospira platensis SPKY1]|nr:hypothetical protein [Arthrospira platensis SPKY1]
MFEGARQVDVVIPYEIAVEVELEDVDIRAVVAGVYGIASEDVAVCDYFHAPAFVVAGAAKGLLPLEVAVAVHFHCQDVKVAILAQGAPYQNITAVCGGFHVLA